MSSALLGLASCLVPSAARSEWIAEWRAELWHVRRLGRATALAFSLGAFRDALWMRRHHATPRTPLLASPAHCMAVLAALATIAVLARPAVRQPDDTIAIWRHARGPLVTFDEFRALTAHAQSEFASIAFYRTAAISDDPGGSGYVLARAPGRAPGPRWHLTVSIPGSAPLVFECAPQTPRMPAWAISGVLAVTLTLLWGAAPITFGRTPRAWLFLAAKLALSLAAVYYFAQLLHPAIGGPGLIVGFILAIRWAFHDQRRRCPVCLRLTTNPVSFGCLSHTLLDWHGAEFICPRGHGLWQVSATSASPYAPHLWLNL
jgi:hypothetical protein